MASPMYLSRVPQFLKITSVISVKYSLSSSTNWEGVSLFGEGGKSANVGEQSGELFFFTPQPDAIRVTEHVAHKGGMHVLGKGRTHLPLFAFLKKEAVADDSGIGDEERGHGQKISHPHPIMREEVIDPGECPA